MPIPRRAAFAALLLPGSLAAQDNPFAFTGGSVKTAYIVYEMSGGKQQQQAAAAGTYEIGVAPDRWIIRMSMPFDMGGKKDTLHTLAISTKDSQYTYNRMGSQGSEAKVSPTLRPHLAREYAALDAAAKMRFRQNVRLATEMGGGSDADAFVTLFGEKTGSETIAGHKCDVYRWKKSSACVIPGAPMVMLRWMDPDQGVTLVAKKVTLNGPIPPALGVLPKGVQWKKSPEPKDADFITNVWALKHQDKPAAGPPAVMAKDVVRYLASAQAAAELKEMGAGQSNEAEESGEATDSSNQ
ncbi:MAG TPA: hypothetical protein VIJ61_12795 [Thermoanaerobaculia bacterium]